MGVNDESRETIEIAEGRRFYVYELYDKRPEKCGQVFYVGKGQGGRALQHVRQALRLQALAAKDQQPIESSKINRILEIGVDGVGIRVVGRFELEEEAFAAEGVLISWVYGLEKLTNISRGKHGRHTRRRQQALDEIPGMDLPRRVAGTGNRTGYLRDIIIKHEQLGHFEMAQDIRRHLIEKLPNDRHSIQDPCIWENGRYVGIFVTLVPGKVRMIIQFTASSKNVHVYNLKPVSESVADRVSFAEYLQNYNELMLRKDNRYSKLPSWEDRTFSNEDYGGIVEQVKAAKSYFPQP